MGEAVTGLAPGAHVIGAGVGGGAFAEYVVLPAVAVGAGASRAGPTSRRWAWS